MDDLLRLDGRIVVVSGAGGGGIGTTITRMAAQAGATVVAVSRSKENLDEHVAPLAEQGLSVVPVSADASTDEGIAAVMDQVRRTDGDLYGLLNSVANPADNVLHGVIALVSIAVGGWVLARGNPGRSAAEAT